MFYAFTRASVNSDMQCRISLRPSLKFTLFMSMYRLSHIIIHSCVLVHIPTGYVA